MAVSKLIEYNKYLSIAEAANYSGYSKRHLTRLAKNRQLKARKVLGLWLVELESLKSLEK
jgi:excisionase family DNA binding protein